MNNDIRLAVSFRGHRKRKRLRKMLGPDATDFLIDLWIGAAMNHPSGILQGMDEIDIALEAGWSKKPEKFVSALEECGFLEKLEDGNYSRQGVKQFGHLPGIFEVTNSANCHLEHIEPPKLIGNQAQARAVLDAGQNQLSLTNGAGNIRGEIRAVSGLLEAMTEDKGHVQ